MSIGRKKDAQSSFLMDGASSDGEDNLTDYDEDYDDGEIVCNLLGCVVISWQEVDGEDDDALKMFMDTTGGKRMSCSIAGGFLTQLRYS